MNFGDNLLVIGEGYSANDSNTINHYFSIYSPWENRILKTLDPDDTDCTDYQVAGDFLLLINRDKSTMAVYNTRLSLQHTTMPTVLLDNFIANNPNVCYIGTDSYEGIAMAVKHLYTLGHKNIAFLNGSLHSMVSEQRQEAFETSMASLGLEIQQDLMAYGYYVADSAQYHVPGFLSAGATAIICGNDLIASGVISECTQRGFRVPEDISVIGFDDIPLAPAMTPPLTTIRQDRNELGKGAYVVLNSLIHHISISKMLMRPQLIERESATRVSKEPRIIKDDLK